jgi:NodT family efflux transporter outer membrane factor (OMF) lipoprotein
MRFHWRLASVTCLASTLAAGCAPKVRLPVAPEVLSTEWRDGPVTSVEAFPASISAALGSPGLARLVARALAANADLAAAAARVSQARAQLRVARASMLPVVSASAGLGADRTDDKQASPFDFSDAFAGLDVSYEVDLFGRLSSERRSARARVNAVGFDREALALTVETEVARAFVQHAALTDRLGFLDRNLTNARELERIVGVRRRYGEATLVDTGLQAIEVRELEAERTRLEEARTRTRNALAILVGEEAPLFSLLQATLASFVTPSIAPFQPGLLLVRRPDIRAAEARISAAAGDVARARAAFLPQLSLSASGLGQAAALGGPFGATLSVASRLVAPIFDRRRLTGELAFATAAQLETVELYRGALVRALAEVEDALAATAQAARRQAALEQALAQARTAARLSRLQYLEGEADLRATLDSELRLVAVEDALVVVGQERLEAAIDLYRAMGGAPRI